MADIKQSDVPDYSGNLADDDRLIVRRPSDPTMSPTTGSQVEISHGHLREQVIHRGPVEPTGGQTVWFDTADDVEQSVSARRTARRAVLSMQILGVVS